MKIPTNSPDFQEENLNQSQDIQPQQTTKLNPSTNEVAQKKLKTESINKNDQQSNKFRTSSKSVPREQIPSSSENISIPEAKIEKMVREIQANTNKDLHAKFEKQTPKIKELETLQKNSNLYTTIKKIILFLRDIANLTPRIMLRNYEISSEAHRTQEHLTRNPALGGSHLSLQLWPFYQALDGKSGFGFEKLRKELSQMKPIGYLNYDPLVHSQKIQKQLNSLKSGESMWIDAGTAKGHHGMMMRLTRLDKDDKIFYKMQFANTGGGLPENSDFHQEIPRLNSKDKTKFQTVALINDIPAEKFNEIDFFNRFFFVAHTGIDPSNPDKTDPLNPDNEPQTQKETNDQKESIQIINKMYVIMRELGKPEKLDPSLPENSGYFSRPQIGGSCVPSSMWAMARFVLSKEERQELKLDMRFQSLLHNYEHVKNGWGQMRTAKILALDQIQTLKGKYKKSNIESPDVLSSIEKELLGQLGMQRTEIKISESSRKDISKFLTKTPDNNYTCKPMRAFFTQKKWSLILDLELKEINIINIKEYKFKKVNNHLEGVDLFDDIYLLYYSIANGDHELSYINLQRLMKNLGNNSQEIDKNKAEQTAALLMGLGFRLKDVDTTRSGIAKESLLIDLAAHALLLADGAANLDDMYSKYSKDTDPKPIQLDIKSLIKYFEAAYADLKVDFYEKDNIWVDAHNIMSSKLNAKISS